jgi:hypothetical protein
MIKVTPDIEQPRPNLLDAAMELDLQDDYSDESDGSYQWEDSDQDGGGISYDNTLVDNVRQAIKIRRNNKYSTSAIISEEMNSRLLRYSNSPGVNVEDDVLLWKINSDKLDQPFIIHGKHDYGTMLILPPALFDKLDSDKVQVELVKGVPLIKDIQVKYDPTITEDADIQDELTKIIKYCFPVLRKGTELISSEGNKYIVDNLLGEDGLSLEIGRTIGVGDIEIPAITLLTDEAVETTKQRMIDTKMKLAEAKQQEEIRGEMMRARMEEEERNRRQAEFDASHRAVATSADRPSSANLTLAQLREENMRLRKEAMERQSKKQ